MRKPVIGVMGGSKVNKAVSQSAERLGRLIAKRGWILLNGGRNSGVMAASAKGAQEAGGTVIGILPDKTANQASPHLDIAVMTGMGDARNLINVLSSDVVIACKGALGTLCEIVLALTHGKTVILLEREVSLELERYERQGRLVTADSPEDAVARAAAVLASKRA